MTRRSSLVLFSVFAHACVLIVVLVASVMATGSLPTLAERLIFDVPGDVKFTDVHLAPPPPASPRAPAIPPVNPNAAPIEAPASILPEQVTSAPREPQAAFAVDGGVLFGSSVAAIAPPPPPPPPPPPAPPAPLRVSSGVQQPTRIFTVEPAYPAAARAARIEGRVIIEATIGTDGRVESARVLRSVALLEQAALDAVRQWRFTPTILNGTAVPVIMTVTVNFSLSAR